MNKKGVSPVIATVILVAVAITISVAVAYWMGSITSQYTRIEKLEVTNIQVSTQGSNYTILISVRNTGTIDVTVTDLYVNQTPYSSLVKSVLIGQSTTIPLSLPMNIYLPGQTVSIRLHTATGMDYVKMAVLP